MHARATMSIGPTSSAGHHQERARRVGSRRPTPRDSDPGVLGTVILFVVVTALLAAAGALPTLADRRVEHASVVGVQVGSADTLWSIARANPLPGVATAQVVARIRSLNRLAPDSTIQPGDTLSVPSPDAGGASLAMR